MLLASVAMAVGYWVLLADLPDPSVLGQARRPEPVRILDRHGRLLYEWLGPLEGKHTYVPLIEIPLALQQATLATEDVSFYANPGVDLWAVARAIYQNLRHGQIVSGASTITQQVARMLLLSPEERWQQTGRRKVREAYLAWRIARAYSKDQVIELYLNHTYYGNLAYGIGAAARAYFGKPVGDLDLAECALLAGLPQSPIAYNPLTAPEAALERQATVLGLMVQAGFLDPVESKAAGEERMRFAAAPFEIRAPHFCVVVQQQIELEHGAEVWGRGGWIVHTTLDLDLQTTAEDTIRRHLDTLNNPARTGLGHNISNAALVALDPRTGDVLAMVGSPDYFDAAIDGAVNATLAFRQPGSAIKPITYAAALERGFTTATIINDVRKAFPTAEGDAFVPINYDRQYHGPISLRRALATSSNAAAVSVLDAIGIPALMDISRRMGIVWHGDPARFGLALTLGGGEVRLLDLTTAFARLAASGQQVEPRVISRIEDTHGRMIERAAPPSDKSGLDPRITYLITDVLSDDVARTPAFGEQSPLYLGRPAAVKTGTTTDWRDNWAVGYTPDLVTGVWVGNADNEPMTQVTGITGAAPIWNAFMRTALRSESSLAFGEPSGIAEVVVCPESGLLPGPQCPNRIYELFLEGTQPSSTCQAHQLYRIDVATGTLASESTPPGRVAERVYWILPAEARDWGRAQGLPEPPTSTAPPIAPQVGARMTITSPEANARYVLSRQLPGVVQSIEIAVGWHSQPLPGRIILSLDGNPMAILDGPPFRTRWPLAPGDHELVAQAEDAEGIPLAEASVSFSVHAGR